MEANIFKQGIAFIFARNVTSDDAWPAILQSRINYFQKSRNYLEKQDD